MGFRKGPILDILDSGMGESNNSKYTDNTPITTLLNHEQSSSIGYKFKHVLGIRPWRVSNPFNGGIHVLLGALTIRPPDRDNNYYNGESNIDVTKLLMCVWIVYKTYVTEKVTQFGIG